MLFVLDLGGDEFETYLLNLQKTSMIASQEKNSGGKN
jgi:hypothetical protein